MDNCNMFIDIFLPIICALISGGLTVIGVLLTIKHENKKSRIDIINSKKPYIYRIDYMQEYNSKDSVDYNFYPEETSSIKPNYRIYGILKNTDNAIMILDNISINGKKFYSINGDVIDKNTIFNIYIYSYNKMSKDDEIILSIKDILNNRYRYKLEVRIGQNENNIPVINFFEIK